MRLVRFDININDYARVQEESVTGEKLPTRYAIETGVRRHTINPIRGLRCFTPRTGPSWPAA